jgi:protein-disulfide isomerase
MHPIVKRIIGDFDGKIRLVVRYMPFHSNSVYAATALEAARLQAKYWEALDLLLEKQPEWGSHHAPKPELIPGYLQTLGLNMDKLKKDMADPALAAIVQRDKEDGMALGVRATPSFFINGRPLTELGYGPLREMIVEEIDK